MLTLLASVDFGLWKEYAEEQYVELGQEVAPFFLWKIAFQIMRLALGAARGVLIKNNKIAFGYDLLRLLHILFESMKPHLDGKIRLCGVKVGEVLVCQETGNAVGIQLCFNNVSLDSIVELLEHHNILLLHRAFVKGASQRYEKNQRECEE